MFTQREEMYFDGINPSGPVITGVCGCVCITVELRRFVNEYYRGVGSGV